MAHDSNTSWSVDELTGSAAELHAAELPWKRSVVVMRPTRHALVLGSTQASDIVDESTAELAGFDVVRRRSGGGLVALDEHALWIDVTIERTDPLYVDDVSLSTQWLGEAWRSALAGAGVSADVHRGAMLDRDHGRLLCFAGLAPGELTVNGAKAVGISQRRGRHGARFQCVAYRRWDPRRWAPALEATPVGGEVGNLALSLQVATVATSDAEIVRMLTQVLSQQGVAGM